MVKQTGKSGGGRGGKTAAGPRALDSEGADRAIRKGRGDLLTERENEVMLFLADGLTNKEAASRLRVSYKTVDTHRTNLMKKLEIHSVTGLVKYALLSHRAHLP